jgi:group I intron endonuclease
MGIIYKITNPEGRIYVGQTFDMRKRLNSHRNSVKKKNCYHIILINSFKKYGFNEHEFEIIDILENCTAEELSKQESYWIKECKSFIMDNPMGMNMTLGGEGQRGKLDERRRIHRCKAVSLVCAMVPQRCRMCLCLCVRPRCTE